MPLTHNPLIIAKKVLGETLYFDNYTSFEAWLEEEYPDKFVRSTANEYKVYESRDPKISFSPIATWVVTETSFASFDPILHHT